MLSELITPVKKTGMNRQLTCNAMGVTLALHGEVNAQTNKRPPATKHCTCKKVHRQIKKAELSRTDQSSQGYGFSIALGDLLLLDGKWYVTHTGLIRLAQRRRCHGISVQRVRDCCDPTISRWVFRATVYKSPRSRGFVGYGDADPSNVSSLVHGAEMRVAETRAVNRALRKAYGIGLCSVEELGWAPRSNTPAPPDQRNAAANGNNGHHNGQPR